MKKQKKLSEKKRQNSIFRRYFLFTVSVVIACLVVLGAAMIVFIAAQWWNEKTETLTRNAQDIVRIMSELEDKDYADEETSYELLSNTLSIMSKATMSDYFIVDSEGHVRICKDMDEYNKVSECSEHGNMTIPENYMTRALKNGFADYATDDVFGLGKFVVAVPSVEGSKQQVVVFAVEDAITGLLPYVLNVMLVFTLMTLVLLILCFIIIYVFTKGLTDPLYEMQEVTKHFAKGEFEHRANENYRKGYLSDFAKSLNKMADELAADEEAQKSFVANVSHELKTPMTTIGGFIDGILDGTIPPEQQKSYLVIVSNEIKRLSRTVVSMLNLSKIEAGEVSIAPVRYDVSKQIFDTLLSFEKQINDKNINVEGFENMGSVTINADKDLIQQVIYNLFDNAVKFTPENGVISISAKNEDEKTVVRIRNTGTGVSDEEISRIFERFYKVDKSRSYDIKGVGLGLYIVKTIINMHDGEITARSENGKYIEFCFEIPD
ncbi:MAG: ATP-binding protein [Acutalibacteraceae bacterium]